MKYHGIGKYVRFFWWIAYQMEFNCKTNSLEVGRGFWEPLAISVKTSLKRILGKTAFFFQELSVIVIQIEAIHNSIPFTYVFIYPCGLELHTPGHFLIGKPTVPQ